MPELNFSVLKDSPNLKAYYRMESGAELVDSSGNSNTLTAIGTPTYSAGQFGQGVNLATNQAFSAVDQAILKPTGAFSVGFWIKRNGNPAAYERPFQSISQNTAVAGVAIEIDTNGIINAFSGKNTGTTANVDYKAVVGATSVCNNAWNLVILTWDTATLRIYVNTKVDGSAAWANAPAYAATNYFRIGCRNDSGTNNTFTNASLDDFFLFNGIALSADQIKELYEGRTVGEGWPQAGLVAGYHLNGNSTDFSGNNNHGTDTAVTYSQTNGKFGQGAGFNGSSVIDFGNASALNFERTSQITIAAWIQPNPSLTFPEIICKQVSGTTYRGWGLYLNSASNYVLTFELCNTNSSNHLNVNSSIVIPTSKMTYVVVTYDGSSSPNGINFYIDGKIDGAKATILNTLSATIQQTETVKIGRRAVGDGAFAGKIDELQVYNVAKDAAWVRKQYAWSVGKFGGIL